QCFDFPGQTFDRLRLRKNEADKRFLIKRIKRIAIHSQLESTRDSAVKLSQPRQLLPNSNSARNEDVSNSVFEGESHCPIPTAPARTRNHARIFWEPFRRLARIRAISIGPREKAPALAFSVRLRK